MKNLSRYRLLSFLFFLSFGSNLIHQSCAPLFSDLQSARMLGPGNNDVTPSFSKVNFKDDGNSEKIQSHYGLQAGFGLSENLDLRTRVEVISLNGGGYAATVVGFGPKFAILEDRIAGYLPVGTALGPDIETGESWEIQPTILFTMPISETVEFNPSIKYIIPLTEGAQNYVAVNFGVGIGEYGKIVFRPEFGMLFNPGESGHYSHFSMGLNLFPKWGD